jgi:hypothetical protein
MIKKNAICLGALIGLVTGAMVFVVGINSTPDMFILKAINVFQAPLFPLVAWVQGASHNWGPNNSGLYKLLIIIAAYWTLIGSVLGVGGKLMFGRTVRRAA